MSGPLKLRTRTAVAKPRDQAWLGWSRTLESGAAKLGGAGGPSPALIGLGVTALAAAGAAIVNYRRGRAAERKHPPIGEFIEVDGVAVHYVDRGEGPPVVLLHGNGAMVEDFLLSGLVERLAQNHRVIAIDRPGYGYTERPRSRVWTGPAQADLMREVVRRLGVERPVVVGHSWGATVAMAWALAHQEELAGIVLLSGYFFPTPRSDVLLFTPPGLPVIGDVMRYTISPPIGRLIAPKLFTKIFAPRPIPRRFAEGYPLGLALRPWQLRASSEETAFMIPWAAMSQAHYHELRLPITIITGDADEIITAQRQSIRLHEEIPHSELRVLPGLGHMIHYFAQDEIAARVEAMLGRGRERGERAVRAPDHVSARSDAPRASALTGAA
jgi:pimeloyl-ACP methyl ester carboxylesterase